MKFKVIAEYISAKTNKRHLIGDVVNIEPKDIERMQGMGLIGKEPIKKADTETAMVNQGEKEVMPKPKSRKKR